MRWLEAARARARLMRRAPSESRMEHEIRFHLEMEAERLMRERGVSEDEARRQALLAFGGVEKYREQLREERVVPWLTAWTGGALQDVTYALRSLRRTPGFTAIALLTLALGIGVNAAMFSIVDGILLRPLPYGEPHELVRVYQSSAEQGMPYGTISPVTVDDWQARTRSFSGIAGFLNASFIYTGGAEPLEIPTAMVSEQFFDVMRAPPQLGRTLQAEDVRQAQRNVVISDRFWRTHLGADPNVVGSSVTVRGESHTVVGVMQPSFRFPTSETDIWAPITLFSDMHIGPRVRDNRFFEGVARLRENVSAERAQSELSAVSAQLAVEYPETNTGWSAATVVPLRTTIVGDVDTALRIVLGVVAFILLIGCANLANLLLARGTARAKEIAIRGAIGAGRGRIVRQLLTESLVLSLAGGALGLAFSTWFVRVVIALSADTLPRVEDVRLDARVFLFAFLLALITALLFGLLPALRTARVDPQEHLRAGRGSVGMPGQRLRKVLVVAEVTLAVVLVAGAGLMARSFMELRSVDPGFDSAGVLTVSMHVNVAGVAPQETPQYIVRTREEIIDRVRTLPGVASVGMVNAFPLRSEGGPLFEFTRADGSAMPDGTPLRAHVRYIGASYFDAMGIAVRRGTALPEQWAQGAPVPTVISESAARRFWPNLDPIGQRADAGWAEAVIVGVVEDVREEGLTAEAAPMLYFPQQIAPRIFATLVVRTPGDPAALVQPVRAAIQEVAATSPIREVATLRSVVGESIAQNRFFTIVFGVFGALALVLATLGVYGVLAYTVSRRTQEIGVRMALGARAGDVLRMVIVGGVSLVGAGIVIGTLAALLLTRVLQSQLYGVSSTDPLTFLTVIGVLTAAALVATYLPARRATRVDPLVGLRTE